MLFELFLEGALTICFHDLHKQFFSSWSAMQMKAWLRAAGLLCSKFEKSEEWEAGVCC